MPRSERREFAVDYADDTSPFLTCGDVGSRARCGTIRGLKKSWAVRSRRRFINNRCSGSTAKCSRTLILRKMPRFSYTWCKREIAPRWTRSTWKSPSNSGPSKLEPARARRKGLRQRWQVLVRTGCAPRAVKYLKRTTTRCIHSQNQPAADATLQSFPRSV